MFLIEQMNYRILPKPEYFETVPAGTCRWCNKNTGFTPKGKPKTSRWHPECLEEYKFYYWPASTRKVVWERDKGLCSSCGIVCEKYNNGWHLDHIQPLIEAKGNKSFWQLSNMQTLCKLCHKYKTAAEATARANERKIRKHNVNI